MLHTVMKLAMRVDQIAVRGWSIERMVSVWTQILFKFGYLVLQLTIIIL